MKLFGTDGIRGIANQDLTPELAFKTGKAIAFKFKEGKKTVLIGKDTRHSGDMIEAALIAGITSTGYNVKRLGIAPTPAVSYLTKKHEFSAGIVISASHNPGEYNGIKIFDNKGLKLSDIVENELESLITDEMKTNTNIIGSDLGIVKDYYEGSEEYEEYLKTKIDYNFKGKKVAMDCGNGALYEIGPRVFKELGAEVIAINTKPDGMNINLDCGSTNPKMIQDLVIKEKADIGISFDGDGDRIIATDENGKIINGDHILAILGTYFKDEERLTKNMVVGTIMSNMGLDEYLEKNGMGIVKTQVGDRYILEEMVREGYSIGGEQSGHIIMMDYNTTGDGLATGLKLLKIASKTNKKLSQLNNSMKDFPQVLVNAKVKNTLKNKYDEYQDINDAIEEIEKKFEGKGRVVIRPSGTEPLVRVMIEAKNGPIEEEAKKLASVIEDKLK